MVRTNKTAPAAGARRHKGCSNRASRIPAADVTSVEANCAYVIPPERDMANLHGFPHLGQPVAPRGPRAPIGTFFCSLGEDHQERAIRTGQPASLRDARNDPAHDVRRDAAAHSGYQAACALALPIADGRPPVLTLHAAEPDAFASPEVALLEQLTRHVKDVLSSSHTGASHRTATHRTDPAETLPGPERRREGSP